jgi:hypothetical protein
MKKLIIIIASTLLIAQSLYAANYYVTKGGAGAANGSDWNNALSWAFTPARGDGTNVYFISGGTYTLGTYKNFSTADDGVKVITLRKATTGNSGSVAGWSASYDNQAVIPTIQFSSSFWLLDGVTGSGKSGHGFKIVPDGGRNKHGVYMAISTHNSITVSHAEIASAQTITATTCLDSATCAQYGFYSINSPDNIALTYSWIHDIGADLVILNGATNVLISDNTFEDNAATTLDHGDFITFNTSGSTVTIKNNTMRNGAQTAYIAWMNPSALFSGYDIFNNIIYDNGALAWTGMGDGFIAALNSSTVSNVNIYENTIVNLPMAGFIYTTGSTVSNWNVKNNLWFCDSGNCGTVSNSTNTNISYDKNWYGGVTHNESENGHINGGAENPFVNSATYNFALASGKTPIDAGVTLSAAYNTDISLISRPQGTAWDIGAYEYSSGTTTTWTVTASYGSGGTLSCNSPANEGSTTTCTASPTGGYYTSSISGCGGSWASGNSYTTAAIAADCTVTAGFTANPVSGGRTVMGVNTGPRIISIGTGPRTILQIQ